MSKYFSNLQAVDDAHLVFDIKDIPCCIINSTRRAIMTHVQTASIRHPKFIKNSTALNNEFFAHRLSLVPIHFDENQLAHFLPDQYNFAIRMKNNGKQCIDITTNDIQVYDQAGAAVHNAKLLFPADPLSKDHILLAHLRPGEEINVDFQAFLGSGKDHAGWSPVSKCFFKNKINPDKFKKSLSERIAANPDKDPKLVESQHLALEGQRDFFTDDFDDANQFEMHITSECGLRPSYIMFEGLRHINNMIETTITGLQEQDEAYELTTVPNVEDMYQLAISNADHTLGNLIQRMLYINWVRNKTKAISYIGYTQPHPLEKKIIMKIKASVGIDMRETFIEGLKDIQKILDDIIVDWIKVSGLDKAVDKNKRKLGRIEKLLDDNSKTTLANVVKRET